MNILILGYGLEGKAVEAYFKQDPARSEHTKIDIVHSFTKEELLFQDFSAYDLIFRTPSLPPKFINAPAEKITSCTKFFFAHCPCPIIGVTGTKGKGTTCTLIRNLLNSILTPTPTRHVYLVGNIGVPAIEALPDLTPNDVVIYELSSFQLWDLKKSPTISVVLRIEPDHLDVHDSFSEYLEAKKNIVRFQSPDDSVIYFKNNPNTTSLINDTVSQKFPYPLNPAPELLSSPTLPGEHNKENAQAALLAVYTYLSSRPLPDSAPVSFTNFLEEFSTEIRSALASFQPLPHHIEHVRDLNGVSYYDDSFSTVLPSLDAALASFPDRPLVLIAGGKDKGVDIKPVQDLIFHHPHLIKAVLIGETAEKIAWGMDPEKFVLAGTDFESAVSTARDLAEAYLEREEENSDTCLPDARPEVLSPVVLLSPCASSFDMFSSYKDRGDKFKTIVNSLT